MTHTINDHSIAPSHIATHAPQPSTRPENTDVWENKPSRTNSILFKGGRRLFSISIPRSRHTELAEVHTAGSVVLWTLAITAILTLTYAVDQFCVPFPVNGVVGLMLTLFSIHLWTVAFYRESSAGIRLLVFYIALLAIACGIIIGLDSSRFVKTQNSVWPLGCNSASSNDKPITLPTTCDRFKHLAIVGMFFISTACAVDLVSLMAALVLSQRLQVWEQAKQGAKKLGNETTHNLASSSPYRVPVSKPDVESTASDPLERFRIASTPNGNEEIKYSESSKPSSSEVQSPVGAPSSTPSTPIELYHLTDFQRDKRTEPVGSK